jgi:hypothetical protein
VLVLLGVLTVLGGTGVGAAPPGQGASDVATALLTPSDLPAGWTENRTFDWQRVTIPDGVGGYTSLGRATSAEPRPSITQLGENVVGVEFTQRIPDGAVDRYRGVQHAVIPVPAGQGAAKMTVLREAMRPGTFRVSEPDGLTMVWEYSAMDAPALGDEAHALRVAAWHEEAGRRVPGNAHGVYYAFRRGDYIVFFSHLEGAGDLQSRDTALTDRLAGVADQRLAAFVGATVSDTDDGGANWLPWTLAGVGALVVAVAGAALFVARTRQRPHAPHPA